MQRKETSAEGVRKFQKQLGLPVKSFPDLGLHEIEKNNDSNVANDDTDDARTELAELLNEVQFATEYAYS